MSSSDEIRETQRRTWDDLSTMWDKWDAVIMRQLAPVGAAMVAALGARDDHQVLDVASGTGEPGLTVAAQVPRGRVVLSDLSPQMLEVAVRRAAAQGLANIETATCSADDLPFAEASFDGVTARFGYMFFPELDAATAEMARVLRPGGRLTASVWAGREDNPWATLVVDAVGEEIELPAPPPGAPGVFRCSARGLVPSLLADAGLRDVQEVDVPVVVEAASPELGWEVLSEHVAPAAAALARLDDAARARVRERVVGQLDAYVVGDGVRVPGLARVAVGTR
ncbi:MAG: class I SAM-dependent methyltransferase [Candidatus Nanopelagicales bacterium]